MSENKTMIRPVKSAFALKGVAGDHEDKQYLIKGDFKVGREQDNDIIINEGFVSRHHATIRLISGMLTVTDNDSSNGTYVNDESVKTSILAVGDKVRFDVVEFLVCDADADNKKTAITPPADNSAKSNGKRQAELERELIELQRIQQEREEQLRQENARLAQEKAEQERIAKEKTEQERVAKEKAEQERIAKEKAAQERVAKDKAEKERIAKEKAEQERVAKEKAEQDRVAKDKAETERIAKEKAEQERIAKEKAEQERVAKDKAEKERIAKEKAAQERVAKEKAEKERIAKEKAEQERVAKEKTEQERIAQEKAEQERIAKEKTEQERIAKEKVEQERLAKEKAEQERIVTEKAEKIKLEQEKMEQARLLKEQQQREKIEQELKVSSEKAERHRLRKQQQQEAANRMAATVEEDEDKTVFASPTTAGEKTVFAPIADSQGEKTVMAAPAAAAPEPGSAALPAEVPVEESTIRRDDIKGGASDDADKTLIGQPAIVPDTDKTMVGAPPVSDQKTVAASTLSASENDKTLIGMPPPGKEEDATLAMGQDTVTRIKQAAAKNPTNVELLGLTEPVIDRKFKLNKSLLTIGRSPFNDIIIKASSVSSQHAELEKIDGAWVVRDLGSSNGTYINDMLIEEGELYSDDCLMFGEVELTFDPNGLMPPPDDRAMDVIDIGSPRHTGLWVAIGGAVLLAGAAVWLLL